MRIDTKIVRHLMLIAGLAFSTEAMAQTAVAKFHIRFSGTVDCQQPIQAQNIPISGDGTGAINTDGSAFADVTETAFIFSSTIHFDGRLGARPTAAPGGPRASPRHRQKRSQADLESAEQRAGGEYSDPRAILLGQFRRQPVSGKAAVHIVRRQYHSLLQPAAGGADLV
jgi:hypothetical protein